MTEPLPVEPIDPSVCPSLQERCPGCDFEYGWSLCKRVYFQVIWKDADPDCLANCNEVRSRGLCHWGFGPDE